MKNVITLITKCISAWYDISLFFLGLHLHRETFNYVQMFDLVFYITTSQALELLECLFKVQHFYLPAISGVLYWYVNIIKRNKESDDSNTSFQSKKNKQKNPLLKLASSP